MINFDFYTPTRVLFGADRENEAGKQVAAFGGHKVMIIYGKKGGHVESSGLLERVHQSLNGAGLSYIDFSGVVPNPRLSLVKEGIRMIQLRESVTELPMILKWKICFTVVLKQIKTCPLALFLQSLPQALKCLLLWFSPLKMV